MNNIKAEVELECKDYPLDVNESISKNNAAISVRCNVLVDMRNNGRITDKQLDKLMKSWIPKLEDKYL